jgi:hypothetical protein
VRAQRVRLAGDLREVGLESDGARGSLDALVDRRGVGRAEFRPQVVVATDPVVRQARIQLERMPAHDRLGRAGVRRSPALERGFELSLAHVAPRADDVGDDVDAQRVASGFEDRVHARSGR